MQSVLVLLLSYILQRLRLMTSSGPVYTPLQPASRPPDNMEKWSVGALPLHGRASMPAEMGPAYVFLACSW